MRKTAFITAFNPGNMGMYTVDRAIIDMFAEHKNDYKILCAHSPFKTAYYKLRHLGINIGIKKRWKEGIVRKDLCTSLDQLNEFERIVFWGDFTLNPEYGFNDFTEYDERFLLSSSKEESIQRWKKLYSTSDLSSSKIMTFGQNFQSESLVKGNHLSNELTNIMGGVSIALPRDSKSLNNLKTLDLANCNIIQACDPAMMKITNHNHNDTENHFVYYFSRSNISSSEKLISQIADKLQLTPVELKNWNYFQGNFESRWQNFNKLIKSSKFVLTDTYHCAVNAISLNKIPLVLSNPAHQQHGTLGDFKKQILLRDCHISKYLFETDETGSLTTETQKSILDMANSLKNTKEESIAEKLNHISKTAESTRQIIYDFLEVQ